MRFFLHLVLLVNTSGQREGPLPILANVDARHVKALPCQFQLIQLKAKLVVWVPGLKVQASSIHFWLIV